MQDWQTWAALGGVVLAVLFLLVRKATGGKKKKSCGHNCGCGK